MCTLHSSLEKIPVTVFDEKNAASNYVAQQIAKTINVNNQKQQTTVLGLSTGTTPIGVYNELIRMHKEEGVSFKNVIAFNLDEYYPISSDDVQSYNRFMHEHFFNYIDIKPEKIHIPDGSIAPSEIEKYCADYEKSITSCGGIDIQIVGIGRSGHIGFNEPGSMLNSTTRLVTLNEITIEDAIKDFGSEEATPINAITMGVKTIMNAKKVFLIAWGDSKAEILQRAVEGEIDSSVPASFLQQHPSVECILDHLAASQLSRIKTPWLSGICEWDNRMKKKAILWLCQHTEKPILKLTEADYKKWSLSDLAKTQGTTYNLNLDVYNQIQQTITGWPGGKPNSDDNVRPERSTPFPKRVVVFSPHPDDDVISMGGTLLRLVEQGHNVHVVYQTSGNIAVSDEEAHRYTDFALAFSKKFNIQPQSVEVVHQDIVRLLNKKSNSGTPNKALQIKGLIRQGEAISACRFCGVDEKNIHFLEMPFYETGNTIKRALGDEDINLITKLLNKIEPHQIFAAGDLHDPHGTHAVCLQAITTAIETLKKEKWMNSCYVWLYRGAWQEWEIEEIDMAVPISPEELLKKRNAIFKHQSQKDSPVFPGKDKREFWQRAEDRNKATARVYDELGLTEYEAIEAFKRYLF